MTVAQGINKIVTYKKQVGLGSPAAGAGGQKLRRVTFVSQAPRDTFENNEIVSHQQSTGATLGIQKPNAKLDGLLSPKTYAEILASLLRKDLTAGVSAAALTVTIAANSTNWNITRSAGSWLTDGFKAGDVVRLSGGGFNAANIAKNILILSITSATVFVGKVVNGSVLIAEAAIAASTCAVVGKKTLAPTTGHTTDWYSVEDFYSDLVKSEVNEDGQPAVANIGLPATGNATISLDWIFRKRTPSSAQVLTTPTAETGTTVVTGVNGIVVVNGGAVTNVTGAQLTIAGNVTHSDPTLGSNFVDDLQRGRIMVTGSFTAKFDSTTLQDAYVAGTTIQLVLLITTDASAAADFVTFSMSKIKLTGDAPDDGEKAIIRTYPFTAEINGSGGAALANDNTILSMQDSAA